MIDRTHQLPIARQAEVRWGLGRGAVYYELAPGPRRSTSRFMRRIDCGASGNAVVGRARDEAGAQGGEFPIVSGGGATRRIMRAFSRDQRGRAAAGHEQTAPRASGVSVSLLRHRCDRAAESGVGDGHPTYIPMARATVYLHGRDGFGRVGAS